MNLLQLRYFIKVVEKKNLTKAANELLISPPSLCSTIKRLENELDCELFLHDKKNMILSKNGEIFYEHAIKCISILDKGINELSSNQNNKILLSMGSPYYWLDFLLNFEETHQHIVLEKINYNFSKLNDINYKEFDLYLGAIKDLDLNLYNYLPFPFVEYPVILISKNNPISKNRTLTINELKNETFLCIEEFNPSSDKFANSIFELNNFKPKKIKYVDYFSRYNLLLRNKGYVVSTDKGYTAVTNNNLDIAVIPLSPPFVERQQCLAYRKSHKLRKCERIFIDELK